MPMSAQGRAKCRETVHKIPVFFSQCFWAGVNLWQAISSFMNLKTADLIFCSNKIFSQ